MAVLKVNINGEVLELEGKKVSADEFRTQNWAIKLCQKDNKQLCKFTEPIPFDTYIKKGYLLSDSENSFIDELIAVLAIEGEERETIVRESLYKYWITHPELVRKYSFEDFLDAYMRDELEIDLSDYVADVEFADTLLWLMCKCFSMPMFRLMYLKWLERVVNFCKSVTEKEFECWIEE